MKCVVKVNAQKMSPIKSSYSILIVLIAAVLGGGAVFWQNKNLDFPVPEIVVPTKKNKLPETFDKIEKPLPPPVSMEKIKKKGCVTDGLLSEYNPENENFVELINRSDCYYMHRAIETWLKPPDFETVNYVLGNLTKKDVVYGMFIAEAISTKADYFDDQHQQFDFKAMCREGSQNVWGEHSCKPAFASKEYRDYIKYTTRKAMDLGIQSFMFGQIYMQESADKDYAVGIISDMRKYAKKIGLDIIVGAQTGAIVDEEYLALFDYIEGGVGLHQDGSVENGPCYDHRGGCWALLWHERFSSKAKNVLLHLDWTGIKSDDLDVFARMEQSKRAQTLEFLYQKFTSQNMGFLMPYFGVLDRENGGCYGPKKRFYSPDEEYSCKDEKAIKKIFAGKKL